MSPTGSYVRFNQTVLAFDVLIPESYVPENHFVQKLFEFVEFKYNHVTLISKTSQNDNIMSAHVLHRMNHQDKTFENLGPLEGLWSSKSPKSETLYLQEQSKTPPAIGQVRRDHSEVKLREMGSDYIAGSKSYKYSFIAKINFPFSASKHPLPRNVPWQIIFHRASAKKALMSVHLDANNDDQGAFSDYSITMINPILRLSLASSNFYDKKYAPHKLPRINWPFNQVSVRRDTLLQGIGTFKIKISDGPLPSAIAFGLMDPAQFDGSFTESITNFGVMGLECFNLQIDGLSLPNHPIEASGFSVQNFFFNFNKTCGFWDNPNSNGGVNYESFMQDNFLIVANLKQLGHESGQFTLDMRFKNLLRKNLLIVMIMIHQKSLQMDDYCNVTIHNLEMSKADRELQKLE